MRDAPERKRALWQKDLERWFENGPDDPSVDHPGQARHIDAWARGEDRSFDIPA